MQKRLMTKLLLKIIKISNLTAQQQEAAKNGKIIQLTPDLWYLSGGGLESTKLMIEDAQKRLEISNFKINHIFTR